MNRDDLSPEQREVIEATEPVVLVLGSAGSGKTTAALWAAREHLLREDVPYAQRVLLVTFSRTAVGQIAQRSAAVLADLGARIEIHTFHSLSYRLLRAFGRYSGYGTTVPAIESEARARLLGRDGSRLSYEDLIPAALKILESRRIAELVAARWGLVICDEFQDTSSDQWNLLQELERDSRLLLFADPHQMIHTWIPTVSPRRLEEARELADREILLGEVSHRDPSGVIPAMAAAVRDRNFGHEAVAAAVESGCLSVLTCSSADLPELVKAQLRDARRAGCRSIGVFETTNVATAELGAELTGLGVNYTLIGIPEAQGEGLIAQAMLFACGLGALDFAAARLQLAVFLTASWRGQDPPGLAIQMRDDAIQSADLRRRFAELENALRAASDAEELIDVVVGAWHGLAISLGTTVWRRAARSFAALARRVLASPRASSEELAGELTAAATELHTEALVGTDSPQIASVQLMNRHQTKGREADAVVLVFREGGWVTNWRDREPFEEASRVLYVTLTRARTRVTVVLPPDPHPLVAPFANIA